MVSNLKWIRPQAICWPVICGVDFGAKMRCFVFNDRYALMLLPGRTTYVRSVGVTHVYSPSELMIFDRRLGWRAENFGQLAERGRFTLKRIQSFKDKIDASFHEGVTDLLEWDATLDLSTTEKPWFKIIDPAVLAEREAQLAGERHRREERKKEHAARYGLPYRPPKS